MSMTSDGSSPIRQNTVNQIHLCSFKIMNIMIVFLRVIKQLNIIDSSLTLTSILSTKDYETTKAVIIFYTELDFI